MTLSCHFNSKMLNMQAIYVMSLVCEDIFSFHLHLISLQIIIILVIVVIGALFIYMGFLYVISRNRRALSVVSDEVCSVILFVLIFAFTYFLFIWVSRFFMLSLLLLCCHQKSTCSKNISPKQNMQWTIGRKVNIIITLNTTLWIWLSLLS